MPNPMRTSSPNLLSALLLAGSASLAAAQDFRPFIVEWPRDAQSPASVSFLLDGPAGKHGFVRSAGGHLAFGNGKRFRIWGVNVTAAACLPSRENAPVVAAHLARVGVNCVRFHFLDRTAPTGLVDASRDATRALDPAQLERLDWFITELKQRGIYADLNLNVGRTYKAGDGVRDHELLGFAKSLTYFDARLIELQKEYARQLLTHRNPHTGAEYRHEPAVALVELVNENSLVEAWMDGRLRGQNTQRNPGTWTDIPASYAQDLTDKYNAWLKGRFPAATLAEWRKEAGVAADAPLPRLRPDQFAKAGRERFHAEATFYMEVERAYFLDMQRYLREEIGLKPLVAGNSDHGHGRTGYPQLAGTSLLDVVDSHVYWQHPKYLTDAKTGKRKGFEIGNTPMVNDPLRSTVVQLSRSTVAGKPFTVSEVNHPFPAEYACEGIPILTAYAALQDWDGIFWYTLAHQDVVAGKPSVAGHFDLAQDPVKMSQLAAGALLFLRGDVHPARQTVARSYTMEQVRDSIRLSWSESPYFTPGFPLATPLQHATRISGFNGPPTGSFTGKSENPIRSDTGELAWHLADNKRGLVAVNTPRSQALIGFGREHQVAAANLAAEVNPPFCAVTLGALDDQPIARSARLLLTATARAANSNMEWNDKRKSLTSWGAPPTVIEPVTGKVILRKLAGAKSVVAQPLDGAGKPLGPPLRGERQGDDWLLPLGQPATTWYVLTVSR